MDPSCNIPINISWRGIQKPRNKKAFLDFPYMFLMTWPQRWRPKQCCLIRLFCRSKPINRVCYLWNVNVFNQIYVEYESWSLKLHKNIYVRDLLNLLIAKNLRNKWFILPLRHWLVCYMSFICFDVSIFDFFVVANDIWNIIFDKSLSFVSSINQLCLCSPHIKQLKGSH